MAPAGEVPLTSEVVSPVTGTAAPSSAEESTGTKSGTVGEFGGADVVTAWQHPEDRATSAPSTYRPLGDVAPANVQSPADAGAPTPAEQAAQRPVGEAAPEPSAAQDQASLQTVDTAPADKTDEPSTGAGDEQLEQQLEAVRAQYWRRDLRGAAAGYQSLGQAYPDNADLWGEIGNFYYSLRQSAPAAAAYSRAIELLVRQDDLPRARQLLDVLYRLDASAARELEMRLRRVGG
jgi:hypothetical protein